MLFIKLTGGPFLRGLYFYFSFGFLECMSRSVTMCRNGSTCVDLVQDCKQATYTLFISQESKVKTKKTESVLIIFNTVLITNCKQNIVQTTTGAISVICQNRAAAAETVLIKPPIV